MVRSLPRLLAVVALGTPGLLTGAPAWALNPQPEVPSKSRGVTKPKALNPQPEVPSKSSGVTRPKALNPQPEVPSKSKKRPEKKKKPGKPSDGK